MRIPLFALLLTVATPVAPLFAQPSPPPPNSQTTNAQAWAKYPNVSQQFLQGCVGTATLPHNQARVKQSYCRCALSAYQSRYTPELFAQINNVAVKIGKDGPLLVNVMMAPELSQCRTQTGFQ
jgi:hypothetical protein